MARESHSSRGGCCARGPGALRGCTLGCNQRSGPLSRTRDCGGVSLERWEAPHLQGHHGARCWRGGSGEGLHAGVGLQGAVIGERGGARLRVLPDPEKSLGDKSPWREVHGSGTPIPAHRLSPPRVLLGVSIWDWGTGVGPQKKNFAPNRSLLVHGKVSSWN